jgi:hypothetical protein
MNDLYILGDNGEVINVGQDIERWGKFFEQIEKRTVGHDTIEDAFVSTVFLGMDHNFLSTSPNPLLWETMIFWPHHELNLFQERYSSKNAANVRTPSCCRLSEGGAE